MAEFKLSRKATHDLQDIWKYTFANWSRAQADKYTHRLKNTCQTLADNPARGKSCDEIAENLYGYRAGKHIIFYRVAAQDKITIVRILHGSMDCKNRIRE